MASSIKRERQLARERYERQQAKRTTARARKRRWQQVTAVVVAVLVVIGGVVGLSVLLGDDEDSTVADPRDTTSASASPTDSASPSPSTSVVPGACTYAPAEGEASKDVGTPTFDEAQAKKPFTVTVKTSQGDVVVEMAAAKAPCTTNSFRHLATKGYFDGTSCHRLTTANLFVLQCGDPSGTGGGGPGYQFGVENAPADGQFPAGTVAMARASDPNSNGSQFFIVYKDTQLPTEGGGYSIFGKVTKGLDAVEKVAAAGVEGGGADGKPAQAVTISSVQVGTA